MGSSMRTILLSSLALALVGCAPPASNTISEPDQTTESASAPAPSEASPPASADGGSSAVAQVAQEPFNEVPANVSVLISQSQVHNGNFGLSGVARVCGEVPKELNFSAVPAFIVQFFPDTGPPARGPGEATDVTFDSKELVGGITSTSKFFLSLTVQSTAIGSPYALVLDTSQPKMSGNVKLTMPGPGTLQLRVDGTNDRGEIVLMTLTCGPKKS